MKCIDCNKEMKDCSYELVNKWNENYICNNCNIEFKNNKWIVPINKMPTKKQINVIKIINERLKNDFIPITKYQCWKYIDKNIKLSKNGLDFD